MLPIEEAAMYDLTAAERAKYQRVWQEPAYRQQSPALRDMAEIIRALRSVGNPIPLRVLDIGCGTGRAAVFLTNETTCWMVTGVDIALNALEEDIPFIESPIHDMDTVIKKPFDAAYCVDVLEHIPQRLLDASLRAIRACVHGPVYFRIALFPDEFGETLGVGTLHPSVLTEGAWMSKLMAHWSVVNGSVKVDEHHGGSLLVVRVEP